MFRPSSFPSLQTKLQKQELSDQIQSKNEKSFKWTLDPTETAYDWIKRAHEYVLRKETHFATELNDKTSTTTPRKAAKRYLCCGSRSKIHNHERRKKLRETIDDNTDAPLSSLKGSRMSIVARHVNSNEDYSNLFSPFMNRKDSVQSPYRSTQIDNLDFDEGTDIQFIDEILKSAMVTSHYFPDTGCLSSSVSADFSRKRKRDKKVTKRKNKLGIFFEISGSKCTGKTTLLISLAASYLTKTFVLHDDSLNPPCQAPNIYHHSMQTLPLVVLFDTESGIHIPALVNAVRAAVLRKYRSSNFAPEYNNKESIRDGPSTNMIETEIAINLSRIHLCRPCDNFDLICAFEALRNSLEVKENEKVDINNPLLFQRRIDKSRAPVMILLDSISSFEKRDKMMEDMKSKKGESGLSGSTDLIRQVKRFLERFPDSIVFATRRNNFGSLAHGKLKKHSKVFGNGLTDGWSKMSTHRVCLKAVAPGTLEERNGFKFVATSNLQQNIMACPFSISSGGICC
mmetsp:Transcript_40490/g.47388  ORF Transcript_40490/g.47388 Transcript_40490/m.47388 type:complete len:512 (+) Transcript_40490:98-1633(+)